MLECPSCHNKKLKKLSYNEFRNLKRFLEDKRILNESTKYKDHLYFGCLHCGYFDYLNNKSPLWLIDDANNIIRAALNKTG